MKFASMIMWLILAVLPTVFSWGQSARATQGWWQAEDSRSKIEARPLEYGLATVIQMNPQAFRQIMSSQDRVGLANNSVDNIGLNAEEIVNLVPEAVLPPSGSGKSWMMDYSRIIPVLVNAIKEQQVQIEELRILIAAKLDSESGGLIVGASNKQQVIYSNVVSHSANHVQESHDTYGRELLNPKSEPSTGKLFPVIPNPTSSNCHLKFFVSGTVVNAEIIVMDEARREVSRKTLIERNVEGQISLELGSCSNGLYHCVLFIDGKEVSSTEIVLIR